MSGPRRVSNLPQASRAAGWCTACSNRSRGRPRKGCANTARHDAAGPWIGGQPRHVFISSRPIFSGESDCRRDQRECTAPPAVRPRVGFAGQLSKSSRRTASGQQDFRRPPDTWRTCPPPTCRPPQARPRGPFSMCSIAVFTATPHLKPSFSRNFTASSVTGRPSTCEAKATTRFMLLTFAVTSMSPSKYFFCTTGSFK
jgi:hypothetical protein